MPQVSWNCHYVNAKRMCLGRPARRYVTDCHFVIVSHTHAGLFADLARWALDRRSGLAIIHRIANFRAIAGEPVVAECVIGRVLAGAGVADVYRASDTVVAVGVHRALGDKMTITARCYAIIINVVNLQW